MYSSGTLPELSVRERGHGTLTFMELLQNHPILVLFSIIFFGIALGSIKVYGLNLGLSGVLFIALAAGHYGLTIPGGVGTLGLALFVYCVGLSAGNRFFSAIAKQGSRLAVMSVVIVGVAALFTCLCGIWFQIPAGISAGIFAGACTSTPALAAATESLPGAAGSGVSIGYGIAYPFGVVGVVLFVQLIPRLLHFDLNKEAKIMKAKQEVSIISLLVKVTQPNLIGQNIADCKLLDGLHCMVTRVVRNGRLMPLTPEDTFQEDSKVLVVGNSDTMPLDVAFLGTVCDNPYPMDSQKERRKLILTNKTYAGAKLRDLKTLRTDGIIISRISRLGFTFVPTGDTVLERNDVLTVVGTPENLTKYGEKIGHRSQDMNQTDLLSLGFGLALGIILGQVSFSIGGGTGISLGIAGGPLIVALLLGHFGRLGPIVGYIPRPTRLLLQDLGLVFFLADAGIKGGADLVQTVAAHGTAVFVMGLVVTCTGMLAGYIVGMKIFKMNILECLGGICGGMTSTPALGAIASKTDSQAPVVSYATAYPVALILMTLIAKMIIQTISGFVGM